MVQKSGECNVLWSGAEIHKREDDVSDVLRQGEYEECDRYSHQHDGHLHFRLVQLPWLGWAHRLVHSTYPLHSRTSHQRLWNLKKKRRSVEENTSVDIRKPRVKDAREKQFHSEGNSLCCPILSESNGVCCTIFKTDPAWKPIAFRPFFGLGTISSSIYTAVRETSYQKLFLTHGWRLDACLDGLISLLLSKRSELHNKESEVNLKCSSAPNTPCLERIGENVSSMLWALSLWPRKYPKNKLQFDWHLSEWTSCEDQKTWASARLRCIVSCDAESPWWWWCWTWPGARRGRLRSLSVRSMISPEEIWDGHQKDKTSWRSWRPTSSKRQNKFKKFKTNKS